MSEFETYLANVDEPKREHLERIRKIVHRLVPEVDEVISYGMPTFKYKKKPLLHMASFTSHLSIFPTGDEHVIGLPELARFRTSKGTLQFTPERPITSEQVELIVRMRKSSIDASL